jgi:ribulose-phosphate 3-epimerase
MILLLMVNPGFGGQSIIPSMISKLSALRENIERRNLDIDIEVDGGINMDTIRRVREAGANIFVAGTAIFNQNPAKSIEKLRKELYRKENE